MRAMAEGYAAAGRYRRRATLSDAELRRLGVTRQDLAWFALYGGQRGITRQDLAWFAAYGKRRR